MENLNKYFREILIYFAVILVGFVVFNGWHPGKTLGSYDLLSGHAMTIARFIENGGFSNSIYDFNISAGSEVAPLTGIFPIQELLLKIFNSPFWIVNLTVLFIMLLNGLVLRSLFFEAFKFVFGEDFKPEITTEALLAFILIFMPMLGWRINHGHINILNGVMAYGLCLLVPLKVYNENFSAKSFALISLALAHVLPFSSFQMIAYALFFALPLFIYINYKIFSERKFSYLIHGVGALLAGLLISSPVMYLTLEYFLGGTSERGVSDKKIFTYLRPSFEYFWSSFSIARSEIPAKYPPFSHHEINYPMTYSLVVIFGYSIFKAFKAKKKIIIPLLLTNILIFMFCFNILGFTDAITSTIKILGAFRVPYRAFIFFNINILISALILLGKEIKEISPKEGGVILALAFIALFIPATLFEVISFFVIFGLFFAGENVKFTKPAIIVVGIILSLYIKGFSERATDYEDSSTITKSLDPFKKVKELNGGFLYKTINYVPLAKIGSNSLLYTGSSVVNSYWHPNQNFNLAYSTIFELPHESSRLSFQINFQDPKFPTFSSLYAIRNVLYQQKGKGMQMVKSGNLKNVWSPINVERKLDSKSIFNYIKLKGNSLQAEFDENVFVDLKSSLKKTKYSKCSDYKILGVRNGQLDISLEASDECLLVIPTNFSPVLSAWDQFGKNIEMFKANGSLLGLVVKAGSKMISVKAINKTPIVFYILKILGFLSILGFFIFEIKKLNNASDDKLKLKSK